MCKNKQKTRFLLKLPDDISRWQTYNIKDKKNDLTLQTLWKSYGGQKNVACLLRMHILGSSIDFINRVSYNDANRWIFVVQGYLVG